MISWAWVNPWTAIGTLLLTGLVLGWMSAVWLMWQAGSKFFSFLTAMFGAAVISVAVMSYISYQSWVEPEESEINLLGR